MSPARWDLISLNVLNVLVVSEQLGARSASDHYLTALTAFQRSVMHVTPSSPGVTHHTLPLKESTSSDRAGPSRAGDHLHLHQFEMRQRALCSTVSSRWDGAAQGREETPHYAAFLGC